MFCVAFVVLLVSGLVCFQLDCYLCWFCLILVLNLFARLVSLGFVGADFLKLTGLLASSFPLHCMNFGVEDWCLFIAFRMFLIINLVGF